jgi:hypothetical protein
MFQLKPWSKTMSNAQVNRIRNTVESLLFSHYLRTGQRLYGEAATQFIEQKFNPYHDPDDGRFTFGPSGGSLPPRVHSGGSGQTTRMSMIFPPDQRAAAPKRKPAPLPWAKTHPGEQLPVWRPRDRSTETELPADWKPGGFKDRNRIEQHADHAVRQFYYNWGRGMSIEEAAAWAANSEAESSGNPKAKQPGGPGRGLYQWGSNAPAFDRRIKFKEIIGVDVDLSTPEQQHRFRDWELANTELSAKRRIDAASGAGAKAIAITLSYLRPDPKRRSNFAADRANIAEAIMRRVRPVK